MRSLAAFPFQILAVVSNNSYPVDPREIRVCRMQWSAALTCSDPNGLLEVLAVAFGLIVNDRGAVLQLARHLGVWVKYHVDPATNQIKWVSLEKRQ